MVRPRRTRCSGCKVTHVLRAEALWPSHIPEYADTWLQMLALTGSPRLWEPRRLRRRLFSAAAQLVTTARHRHLKFTRHWP